jgi:DNA-binding NtrC family response regulator
MRFVAKKTGKAQNLQEFTPKKPTAMPPQGAGPEIYGHDLAVLVLNEEADVLDEVASMLRRRGLVVYLAGSAPEARSMMMAHPEVGVMLADICPLEGETLQLAAQVLAGRPPLPAVELVLITGYNQRPAQGAEPLMNRIGLLQEPLKFRDIAAAVGQALSRAAARRALPATVNLRHYDAD